MELIDNLHDLVDRMCDCYQFENINMFQHGEMVFSEYQRIVNGTTDFDIPPRLKELIKTKELLPRFTTTTYQLFHDCGKPLCRTIDRHGGVHYYDHAQVSARQIEHIFGKEEHDLIFLVEHDMDYHTKKTEELRELSNTKYGFTLYLTAWAEINANSTMFGGKDSVSYKIKKKKLIKHLKLFE